MIKSIIDISESPAFLRIENDQVVLERDKVEVARIPAEDIGVLLVDQQATVYTHSVLTRLLGYGAVVVLCGQNHLPCGCLLPTEGNALVAERLRLQMEASLPTRKRLWRQIVTEKILRQMGNLKDDDPMRVRLRNLADGVRSGDPSNCEGQAGRWYWPAMMGPEFRRDPEGLPPNGLLNYGYIVIRAAVARAVCAAGLHPAIGLHHSNRRNAFALADDLIEVLRPRIDRVVVDLAADGELMVNKTSKAALLGLLSVTVQTGDTAGPLMVGLHRMVASLVACYEGTAHEIELPQWQG